MGLPATRELTEMAVYSVEDCCVCGVQFAWPRALRVARLADRARFWCPNGHGQHFTGPTELTKAQEALADQKRRTEWAEQGRERAQKQAEKSQRSNAAYRGHLKSVKERIANGVCPCCRRSFTNLCRHMKGQHPDYARTSDDAGTVPG